MLKTFKKGLAVLLVTAVLGLLAPVRVLAANPVLSASLQTATLNGSSYSYAESITSSPGQAVFLYAEVRNLTVGTIAHNTNIKLNLPDNYGTNVHPTLTITSSDAATVSDDATVNLTSAGRLRLQYAELTWDADGNGVKEWNSSRLPSAQTQSFTAEGVDFGDLNGGDTFLIQLLFNTNVEAQPSSGSTVTTSAASAPTCQDAKPGKIQLVSITRISPSSAKVIWTKSADADNYQVNFGEKSKAYQFGSGKIGNVSEYTVNFLNPATKYFFSILPSRGCMPGDWSNELSLDPSNLLLATQKVTAKTPDYTSEVLSGATPKPSMSPSPLMASSSATPVASPSAKGNFTPTRISGSKAALGAGLLAILAGVAIIFQPLLQSKPKAVKSLKPVKKGRGRPRNR